MKKIKIFDLQGLKYVHKIISEKKKNFCMLVYAHLYMFLLHSQSIIDLYLTSKYSCVHSHGVKIKFHFARNNRFFQNMVRQIMHL